LSELNFIQSKRLNFLNSFELLMCRNLFYNTPYQWCIYGDGEWGFHLDQIIFLRLQIYNHVLFTLFINPPIFLYKYAAVHTLNNHLLLAQRRHASAVHIPKTAYPTEIFRKSAFRTPLRMMGRHCVDEHNICPERPRQWVRIERFLTRFRSNSHLWKHRLYIETITTLYAEIELFAQIYLFVALWLLNNIVLIKLHVVNRLNRKCSCMLFAAPAFIIMCTVY